MAAENYRIMIDARAYYVEPPKDFMDPKLAPGALSSIFDKSKYTLGQRLQPDLDFDFYFTAGINGIFDGLRDYAEPNLNDSGIGLDDIDEGIEVFLKEKNSLRMLETEDEPEAVVRKKNDYAPIPIGHGRCKCCQYQRSIQIRQ